MTHVDPKERQALRDALQRFDEAYVTVMQAVNRILLITAPPSTAPRRIDPTATASEATGDQCPRCCSTRIFRKGGCMMCEDCKYSLGCGQ